MPKGLYIYWFIIYTYRFNTDLIEMTTMKWTKAIAVKFSSQDFEMVKEEATQNGLSMNSFIRMVVLQALRQGSVQFKPKNTGDI